MDLVRIRHLEPLGGTRLRLTLTDGRVIDKDLRPLLVGPVFAAIRRDPTLFAQASVVRGTVAWPGDVGSGPGCADLGRSPAARTGDR